MFCLRRQTDENGRYNCEVLLAPDAREVEARKAAADSQALLNPANRYITVSLSTDDSKDDTDTSLLSTSQSNATGTTGTEGQPGSLAGALSPRRSEGLHSTPTRTPTRSSAAEESEGSEEESEEESSSDDGGSGPDDSGSVAIDSR